MMRAAWLAVLGLTLGMPLSLANEPAHGMQNHTLAPPSAAPIIYNEWEAQAQGYVLANHRATPIIYNEWEARAQMPQTSVVAAISPSASTTVPNFFQDAWICTPQPDSTAMPWFLRTYRHQGKPRKAYVSVATTGKTQLFVNGMNVSRNLFEPYRVYGDTTVTNIVYDVTPFLRRQANTLSLWYCPSMPHVGRRQVAVWYWGENADGTPFAYRSDENWVSRPSNRRLLPPQSEWQDGSNTATPWQVNHADTIAWQSAATYAHSQSTLPATPLWHVAAPRVAKVMPPSYVDVQGDTLTYVFPHHFQGIVRITFRGTRTGENVYINGFHYICNGTTDEQAFCKFTLSNTLKVIVHGDKYFRFNHVQNVEALEVRVGL